ncbi:MAG: DUF1080 domain-containing protein [Pseudomonadota bacterium]
MINSLVPLLVVATSTAALQSASLPGSAVEPDDIAAYVAELPEDTKTITIDAPIADRQLYTLARSAALRGIAVKPSSDQTGLSERIRALTPRADQIDAARAILRALEADPLSSTFLSSAPGFPLSVMDGFWLEAVLSAPASPSGPWRIHDVRRPQPQSVDHGDNSNVCTPQPTPLDATSVTFVGPGVENWTKDGDVLIASGTNANRISSSEPHSDAHIHLEFATPSAPYGHGQLRGNGGLFLMGLYEVQILDSYDNPTYPDGMNGSFYGQRPPLRNASAAPGTWQCLDVLFRAPRFSGRDISEPARATVILNGVVVQADAEFFGPTAFASVEAYAPHAEQLPLMLQDHGDPGGRNRYRNIWIRHLDDEGGDAQ